MGPAWRRPLRAATGGADTGAPYHASGYRFSGQGVACIGVSQIDHARRVCRGFADGSRARLVTKRGSAEVTVQISDRMREGTLSIPNGLGLSDPDEGQVKFHHLTRQDVKEGLPARQERADTNGTYAVTKSVKST